MKQNYIFMTDSDSELPFDFADAHNIPVVKMPYMLDGQEYYDDNGRSGAEKRLFDRMRAGSTPNTSLLPTAAYLEYFEPILKENDLFFIAFSSNMSATIQNVYEARKELLQKYPGRKFVVVDTLSISYPMAVIVLQAYKLYEEGATMEELEKWVIENRLRSHAWLTVDDLVYLKRGGRISSTNALIGSMLNIKPILCLGRNGKIEAWGKVQGRKKALRVLADKVAEYIENPQEQVLTVIHGDDEESAKELADLIWQKVPTLKDIELRMIGPVIGAHCGPGTLCTCFMGRERDL